MKLLAWDTSSKSGALAAIEWDPLEQRKEARGRFGLRLVSEWTLNVDSSTHSDGLLKGVHEILEASRWSLADVDLFGVGVGPGSFTGLRIGVTTARTLAHALGKPLIGVSSLAALARPAAEWLGSQRQKAAIVASSDACKGELFALWGSARSVADCATMADGDHAGLWKRGVEEQVLRPDELMKAVRRKLGEGAKKVVEHTAWMAVGEGRRRYPEAWKTLPAGREIECPALFPDHVQGRYLGLLAWEAFQAGLAREALRVHPRYLRASDAELKLRAGLLPRNGPTRG